MKTKIRIKSKYKLFTTIFAAILIAMLALTGAAIASGLSTITPKEAYALVQKERNNPDFVIIDIRTPREFKAGHIKSALLIDYYSKDFLKEMKALDKNKIYLIYCRSANRSTKAMKKIKDIGFHTVYNMKKGIKGWVKNGFRIYKDKKKLI